MFFGNQVLGGRFGDQVLGLIPEDHGSLLGLGDPIDHPWALLVDGTRALTGAWDMGNKAITNANLDTGNIATAVVNSEWDTAYVHSQLSFGNPHSVTAVEVHLGTLYVAEYGALEISD